MIKVKHFLDNVTSTVGVVRSIYLFILSSQSMEVQRE